MNEKEFKKEFKKEFGVRIDVDYEDAFKFLCLIEGELTFELYESDFGGGDVVYQARTGIEKKGKYYSIIFNHEFIFDLSEYDVEELWELVEKTEFQAGEVEEIFNPTKTIKIPFSENDIQSLMEFEELEWNFGGRDLLLYRNDNETENEK